MFLDISIALFTQGTLVKRGRGTNSLLLLLHHRETGALGLVVFGGTDLGAYASEAKVGSVNSESSHCSTK